MPPFLPRKRLNSPDPTPPRKRTKLTDVLDADPPHPSDLQAAKNFSLGEDDSESSLSDMASEEFEDVPVGQRPHAQEETEEGQDEDIDWEDAMTEKAPRKRNHIPMEGGNLELNLSKTTDGEDYSLLRAATGTKKGPTKIEREIRLQTHRMHVQFLLYHNAIRNRWICDKRVQQILVQQLPPGITKEIQKWRAASGLEPTHEKAAKDAAATAKGKKKVKKTTIENERSQRNWGKPSTRLEHGKPDLSRGDPIIHLLKVLAAYWKKRFSITAPGLRKTGYASAAERQRRIRSFQSGKHDPEEHGERIENISAFRELGRKCEGSRDVGAQLFTALLRGIGIGSRLVASLQPSGFGWTKVEQADPRKPKTQNSHELDASLSNISDDGDGSAQAEQSGVRYGKGKGRALARRRGNEVNKDDFSENPIDLANSSADASSLSEQDDASVIDITPATPGRKPSKYDRDLPFPTYWTEVISPINSVVIPVSPLVLPNPVASTPEILSTFEPRGAKADKAKQVMAYVIAYSSDGSAKDVTTRYLKRRMWPGKTKGFRIPVEKVPIYNKRGKIKHYEEYDWFKSVMSGYVRTDKMRTAVDDVEESTDLVPQQPERKENKQEVDTLQSLKSSAEFVLERFLRREEALKPNAKPVRTFAAGKGDKLKEENVYLRADVVRCLSAESWHKEGRQIKEGEAPMKLVPIRAVTLIRKREVEEMQRQTGEKPTQGLYSREQTEYIIPPPIKNGIIPKNAYGNIDCFVPSMVPKGAVHIPMRGTVKICKKLGIDYAEAVTGFEFGNKLAVPVVEGVVVAKEHGQAVRDAWEEHAEQQRRKEDAKLEQAVLNLWKRMLMGLRIRERVSDTYGEDNEDNTEVVDLTEGPGKLQDVLPRGDDDSMGGGFLLPHEDGEETQAASSGELIVENHDPVPEKRRIDVGGQYPTPVSMTSDHIDGSSQQQKTLLGEIENSSELSAADPTVDDGLNEEESDVEVHPRTKKKAPTPNVQKNAHISVNIPKTSTSPSTKTQPRTSQSRSAAKATLPSERSSSQTRKQEETTNQPSSRRKRSSCQTTKLSSSSSGQPSTLQPKRKQQPRKASRKAALTSPYFDHDDDESED